MTFATVFQPVKIELISGSTPWSITQFVFNICPSRWQTKYIKTKVLTVCFTSFKAFLIHKTRSGTSLPASFSAWFLKKTIPHVTFYQLPKCHCLVDFTFWDIWQYVSCSCFLSSSSSSCFPLRTKKDLNILRTKKEIKMK